MFYQIILHAMVTPTQGGARQETGYFTESHGENTIRPPGLAIAEALELIITASYQIARSDGSALPVSLLASPAQHLLQTALANS